MHTRWHLPFACGLGMIHATVSKATSQNTTMITDFSQLTPSTDIQWQPCFENFTCTRLIVPLDYDNSSAGTAAIAFMKYAAENENNDTKSVLVNPGGPGGTGVGMIKDHYDIFRETLGPNYNFIGFDPRGVQYSEPSLDCFHGDRRLATNFYRRLLGLAHDDSIEKRNGNFELNGQFFGDHCSRQLNESSRYVGTAAVATDMLTFTERQWQAKGHDPKDAKVYYMGYSYGTVLGATFATLFPDRVGRVLIDGVVDSPAYYLNDWSSGVADTDAAARSFFTLCHFAGPERCAFHNETTEDIMKRYERLVDCLRADPISVSDPSVTEIPTLATYSMLRHTFFQALYNPLSLFPMLAQVLVDLENRNGTSLIAMAGLNPCFECKESDLLWESGLHEITGRGIGCIDTAARGTIETKEDWKRLEENYLEKSHWGGDLIAQFPLACSKWGVMPPPNQKFDGKIGAETDTPLLVLSNLIDPVTPLRSAKLVSSLFPGSGLVVNNAVGHSTQFAPSECVWGHIREYFDHGKMPPADTFCQPNVKPFFKEATGA